MYLLSILPLKVMGSLDGNFSAAKIDARIKKEILITYQRAVS
jgi:hypothetical protein